MILVALALPGAIVPAAPLFQETPTPAPAEGEKLPTRTPIPNLSISDEYCLSCHGQPGQTFILGEMAMCSTCTCRRSCTKTLYTAKPALPAHNAMPMSANILTRHGRRPTPRNATLDAERGLASAAITTARKDPRRRACCRAGVRQSRRSHLQ